LYTTHFDLVPGIHPAAIYCIAQNKRVNDRMLNGV